MAKVSLAELSLDNFDPRWLVDVTERVRTCERLGASDDLLALTVELEAHLAERPENHLDRIVLHGLLAKTYMVIGDTERLLSHDAARLAWAEVNPLDAVGAPREALAAASAIWAIRSGSPEKARRTRARILDEFREAAPTLPDWGNTIASLDAFLAKY